LHPPVSLPALGSSRAHLHPSAMPIDYSKFDNIGSSDDEDETTEERREDAPTTKRQELCAPVGLKVENCPSLAEEQGLDHPVLPIMRQYLEASAAAARGSGEALLSKAAGPVATAALDSRVATQEALARQLEKPLAAFAEADNGTQTEVEQHLRGIWAAIAGDEQEETMGQEEVEELVLAHLCEYPPFLASTLLVAPLRHLALGQSFMAPGDSQMDLAIASQRLAPCLSRHKSAAWKVAHETCELLLKRSMVLAGKLFLRLDLDKDGKVTLQEFLQAAPHALALEVENVALSAGVQALLANPDFADDFHAAMAGSMNLDVR